MDNPLQEVIQKTKISYKLGGVFKLRFIKVELKYVENIYLDYEILIEKVESEEDYQKLMHI